MLRPYIAWKCLKAVMHIYTSSMHVFNRFVCQTSSKQHPSPKVDKEGGVSLRSNHLRLLTLAWFVSSAFLCNMRFVAPISDAIWTFQIANPCFFWRVEMLPASLVSHYTLLGHTVVFLASCTAVLWLLQGAKEWWVICGGWGTVDKCHVDVHDQTPWQGDFINPGTLRLLKLMSVALVYCYPALPCVQIGY